MHGDRDVVSDRAVGSVFVVVSTPILQLFAGVGKAHEPVGIQALRPELAVEGLDEAVIGGFAGPREVQNDIVGIGPEIEIPGDEPTAVVDPDRSGIAGVGTDAFQGLNDVLSAVGEAGIGRRTEPRMGVDNGQDAEHIVHGEWVVDEIHRPDIIRADGFVAVLAQFCLHPPLGVLVAELKPQLVVNPSSLLDIHLPSLSSQQNVDAPISIADPRLADLSNSQFQSGLPGSTGFIMVARRIEAQGPTCPADRHAPVHQ